MGYIIGVLLPSPFPPEHVQKENPFQPTLSSTWPVGTGGMVYGATVPAIGIPSPFPTKYKLSPAPTQQELDHFHITNIYREPLIRPLL